MMMFWHKISQFEIFWTDIFIYFIVIFIIGAFYKIGQSYELRNDFKEVFYQKRYVVSLVILLWFGMIGLLDSIHFKMKEESTVRSVLDLSLSPRPSQFEITYSAPFALVAYNKEIIKKETGEIVEIYPRLKYAGQSLKSIDSKTQDIMIRSLWGIFWGLLITVLLYGCFGFLIKKIFPKESVIAFWVTSLVLILLSTVAYHLMFEYHLLGTNKIGQDVFYVALKCIRTGLSIGIITTLFMLPFALFFGIVAGYKGGWIDDLIQFIYTTLSSIPAILLIAVAILAFQIKVDSTPELRLLILCVILGVTGWTSLCRLLRAETLKLREADYVKASITLGAEPLKIMWKHVLPNLMHIVVITVILDFSSLVLAEAVLSFIGVGVDPETFSFGNMINASRLDMARDPIVWWSITGAAILMFALVFSANVVADAIQRFLNPRKN